MYACIHAPDAGVQAQSFSPWIETIDKETTAFSITPRQMAVVSQVGRGAVASTIDAAILAAHHFPGFTYLPPGHEARILGVLPVDVLPPDPDIFQTLDLWGIRTLADLAQLPEKGIAERLGPRGLWYQKLARGTVDRPLKPEIPEAVYEKSTELDYPLELREPLMFLIAQFLHELCAQLDSQSLAVGALALTCGARLPAGHAGIRAGVLNNAGLKAGMAASKGRSTERLIRLPFPTRDVKFLLRLVDHDLEAHPLEHPVEKVTLTILPVDPRRIQHGLFIPAAPEPEKLELTLGKIRGLVGAKNVRIPQIRNTYRPGWGFVESRLAFRYFRPPLTARVETESGVPKKLWTKVCRGDIVKIAGPWRTSGDWWRPDAWGRDEWDLTLTDGGLYRIYRDAEWFVEGIYD